MIDSKAVIDAKASLAEDVEVGPYAVIGADVEIGAGTRIAPHAVIRGPTRIGRDNEIFQFASIGDAPQDKKYSGEPTRLEIGDRNVIRECCTINRGTVQDKGVTRIGNDNWIMAYVHIAHDCVVGDHTIFANNASLAGHVNIEDYVVLGGFSLVHQFCSVGAHAFTSMASGIAKDVPPYVTVSGLPAVPRTINREGLRRRGFSDEAIEHIRAAFKILYRSGLSLDEARARIAELAQTHEELRIFSEFLGKSRRSIVR